MPKGIVKQKNTDYGVQAEFWRPKQVIININPDSSYQVIINKELYLTESDYDFGVKPIEKKSFSYIVNEPNPQIERYFFDKVLAEDPDLSGGTEV